MHSEKEHGGARPGHPRRQGEPRRQRVRSLEPKSDLCRSAIAVNGNLDQVPARFRQVNQRRVIELVCRILSAGALVEGHLRQTLMHSFDVNLHTRFDFAGQAILDKHADIHRTGAQGSW